MSDENLNKIAMLLANVLALIMIVIKFVAYYLTNSVSILASLTDSGMDLLLSFINLVSLHYSLQPADEEHKFGHEAIEDLAGLFQASIMTVSALFVIKEAILHFLNPELQSIGDLGILIMLITWLITLVLVVSLRLSYLRTGSMMLKTESLHYVSDILTNAAVLISLAVARVCHFYLLEPVLAMAIGAYLLYLGAKLLYDTFNNIMGCELSPKINNRILELVREDPRILACKTLRTRGIGRRKLIHLTLAFPKEMTINVVDQISDDLENKLKIEMNDVDVIIHQEPAI